MSLLEKKWIAIIILVLFSFLIYHNIFGNDFAYDDFDFFVHWETIKSFDNVSALFSGDLPTYHQHVYRPLRGVMQVVVYNLSGGQPFGFHVFALLVQMAGAIMAYLVARKLLKPLSALVAGLVFAALPIHTDNITFMTASFDTVGAVLVLASFLLYIIFREKDKIIWLISSLILAILAFFIYELALIAPLLFILYDLCIREENKSVLVKNIKYYLPYFVGVIVFFIIRSNIVGSTFSGSLTESISFSSRMFTMMKAFVWYIYLTIVGTPLSVAHNIQISSNLLEAKVAWSFLLLLALLVWAIYLFKRGKKFSAFVVGWFFISLAPVANIIQIATFVSEHYLYIASFAWALLFAYGVQQLISNSGKRSKTKIIIVLTIVVILLYGFLSFDRNKDWKNTETIFAAAVEVDPNYAGGYNGIAFYYRLRQDYPQAEEYANKAIEVNPNYYTSHALLGEIDMEQGGYQQAIEHFNKVEEINDSYVSAYLNRAVCYVNLKEYSKAEKDYLQALEIYPGYTLAQENLGMLYVITEDFESAIKYLKPLVEAGANAQVYYLYGISLVNAGQLELGIQQLQLALEINPNHVGAQNTLQNIQAQLDNLNN